MNYHKSNGKQEINFDVQKISMLDLSKLTHDFLLRSKLDSQNPKTYNKTVKGRG